MLFKENVRNRYAERGRPLGRRTVYLIHLKGTVKFYLP